MRLVLGVMLLGLAGLPSCITASLWADGEPVLVQTSERTDLTMGEMLASGDVATAGLWVRATAASAAAQWRLRPLTGSEEVAALLADAHLFGGVVATIEAQRVYVDDELVSDTAQLVLDGSFRAGALGGVTEIAALTPAAKQVLDRSRGNVYVQTSEPSLYLPFVFRECIERLAHIDLACVVNRPAGSAQILSWVFVGQDGVPRYEEGVVVDAALTGSEGASLTLAESLHHLAGLDLLVRVTDGRGGSEVLRLRPDRVWQFAGTEVPAEVVGGRFVHRSTWHLEPFKATSDDAPTATARWPATLAVRETHSQRMPPWHGKLTSRLLLTPPALLLDAVLTMPWLALSAWLGGDDDDDDDEPTADPARRR